MADDLAIVIARALEDEYGNDWTTYMAVSKAIAIKLRRNGRVSHIQPKGNEMSKDIISVITRAMNFNDDAMGVHTAQDILASLTAAGYAVVPGAELGELLAAAQYLCEYGHSDNEMRDRLRRAGKAYDAARAAALVGRKP